MKRHKMGLILPLHLYIILLFLVFQTAYALRFTGAPKTYAKFPKWNACVNATFSFEFKTTQTDGLLMYTDDNGTYDYVEVLLKDGRVRLRMNIVDGKEGSIEIFLASRLNDNRWHRVEIQRNRMETILIVDGISDSRVAFGSDFSFGEISKNNFVFFGGLPDYYYNLDQTKLQQLSLPSSYFEKRFAGEIRNVIYGNCTCIPVRGEMIEGNSVDKFPQEACETDNRCGICLCLSRDDGPGCRCVGLQCAEATVTHYHLPMDTINGETLENPSGLDTRVIGQPQTGLGVMLNSLTIEGKTQWIKVSGPGHRTECFGDLDLCPLGYTLSMWLKFENVRNFNGVYLSNGGHSSQSHGVAMLYKKGTLEFVFRKKDGKEWKVKARDVLPKRWYHVTATWLLDDGLSLYLNGKLMDKLKFPVNRAKASSDFLFNDFYIGRANDNSGSRDLGTLVIDEFHFWSTHKNEKQVRDEGAVYRYYLSMDTLNGRKLEAANLIPNVTGNVQLVPGKVGNGLGLFGRNQYVDLGSFTDSCIGNVSMCMFGFTVSFWAKFVTLENNAFYVASGQTGFTVFSYGSRLYADVQSGDRQYQTSVNGVEQGRWYFVEVTWARNDGLSIYLDLELKAFQSVSTHVQKDDRTYDNFYIGRANTPMISERYANFVVDDFEVFNADRKTLLFLDYIQRGRPRRNYFELEQMSGTRIIHPSMVIETFGNPSLVSGKIGKSLFLDGRNQYADFGEHAHNCFGNIDNCPHGMMTALWFNPKSPEDGMQYLSSGHNGLNVIYRNGKFKVTAETSTRKWIVETTNIKQNKWNYLEISLDPGKGLRVYSDNQLIAENNKSEGKQAVVSDSTISDRFFLGRGNGVVDGNVSKSGAAIYDEMEYWYGTRDFLLAFGYIERGRPLHYIIGMDKIRGSQLEHPSLTIEVFGNPVSVPGKIGKAITFNGPDQYINLGDHHDKCLGNLKKCPHGITISVWIKFNTENNMYILSTGQDGIRVFYRNGYIYVTLETMEKSWRASAQSPRIREWHYLEISWHPEFGLNIYIDNKLKEHSNFRNVPPSPDGRAKMFYIGRPNEGDTAGERFDYSRMSVDEMEIWYGRREELLAFDYIVR
ncbi:hypothetical protein ACJMK2_013699, partial [Sinanodonta woodiana]